MTVSCSDGTAPIWPARKVMPSKSDAEDGRHPDQGDAGVAAPGSLKAVMPLEMASTPVSAVVPLENARRIRKRVTPLGAVDHLERRRVDDRAQGAGEIADKPDAHGQNIMPMKK